MEETLWQLVGEGEFLMKPPIEIQIMSRLENKSDLCNAWLYCRYNRWSPNQSLWLKKVIFTFSQVKYGQHYNIK